MGLNFQKKEQVVLKISNVLENSLSVVIASLEGMTANELTDLRALCRKYGVYVYVVRNTLLSHIFQGTTVFKCLRSLFVGSNIIGFSTVDVTDCVRIFVKFSKEHHGKFKIKGAVFDGVFIEESKVNFLSSLPTYKDCIVKLMFTLRESAIGKLLRVLNFLCNFQGCKG